MEDEIPQTEPVSVIDNSNVVPPANPPVSNSVPEPTPPETPKKGMDKKLLYIICFIVLVILFFVLGVLYERGELPFLNNDSNDSDNAQVACTYNGTEYQNGQSVPANTQTCGTCKCMNGTVECDYTNCDNTQDTSDNTDTTDDTDTTDTETNMVSYDLMQVVYDSTSIYRNDFKISFNQATGMTSTINDDKTQITVSGSDYEVKIYTEPDGVGSFYLENPNPVKLTDTQMGVTVYRLPPQLSGSPIDYYYTDMYNLNDDDGTNCGRTLDGDIYSCSGDSILLKNSQNESRVLKISCNVDADSNATQCDTFVKNLEVEVL